MGALGNTVDLFVVGGGPAGLAGAIAAHRHGLSVMVADGLHPPIDKACGEGVMPSGVRALADLGVELGPGIAVPFHGIRFIDDGAVAEGRFPGGRGFGIRRTTLHRLMVERATEAGVAMRWGTPVDFAADGRVQLNGEIVRCKWMLGADGYNSRVRNAAGLRPASIRRRPGLRQHFRVRPWTDCVEVYWHARGQAYVTQVGADEVCVAIMGRAGSLKMTEIEAVFPALSARLRGAEARSAVRGAVSASLNLHTVARQGVALIGDASGSVDAITGNGLSLAFRQAVALGRALAAEDIAAYQSEHRRISLAARLMARLLLLIGDYGWLRRRVFGALVARREAFDRVLAAHGGMITPGSIGTGTIAELGWAMLRPVR